MSEQVRQEDVDQLPGEEQVEHRDATLPVMQPLEPGQRRVYFSAPVLRTSIILSIMLLVVFVGLWFLLEANIRALFTAPQIGTLIFFMVVMWAIMLGVGFSRMVATSEGLQVRNWFITRRFSWDEVVDITFGAGDSWPYLQLTPTRENPDRSWMVLGIQRAEGDNAILRVREVKALIRAHHEAAEA